MNTENKDASTTPAPHTPNPNQAAPPPAISPPVRPVPAPRNRVLQEVQSQWYFTDEELTRTPSQLDGMSMEAEFTGRSKGVNFITQVGIMLKFPQLTLATAAVYLHRFFVRHSMVDKPQRPGLHPYPIAATALFLASKMEENSRKMREFVVACCRVAQKKPDLVVDEQSKEFWKWRDTILHHEDLLLEALCFDLQLEQPYRILYEFLCFFGVAEQKPLRNASWAFVNDSYFTVLCLQFEPRIIAAAALYAAARLCDVAFPDDAAGRPWWAQIDVDLFQVRRACNRMVRLYETNAAAPVHRQSHPYPVVLPVDDLHESTRLDHGRSPPPPAASAVNGRKRSLEPDQQQQPPSSSPGDSQNPQSPSKRPRTTNSPDRSAALNGHDSSSSLPPRPPPPTSSSAPSNTSTSPPPPPPPPPRPSSRVPAAYRPPARPPPPPPQNQPPPSSSSSAQSAEQRPPGSSSADEAQRSSNPKPEPEPPSSREDIEEGEVDG